MKKIFLFSLILFVGLLFVEHANGQSIVMKTPGKYLMPMDNASVALAGSKKKEGELWVIFSDRPNNPLYSDKGCTSANGKKLSFMYPMYVITETEIAVRVIELKDADLSGNILNNAGANAGWIKKENVLLWRTCLKTRDVKLPEFKDGIFNKKAMVLNIISGSQQDLRIPEFYSSPRCSPSDSINSALVYQINYVYKETPTAYLLGEMPDISDPKQDASKVKGWVLKSQTTAWNHRLAYEINWDDNAVAERRGKQAKAKIYLTKAASGTTLFQEGASYYTKRDIGEVDRYPVLDVFNGVSEVGVIGDLKSANGGKSLSSFEFAKIKHVIDSMSGSLRNVNVIFVIDATSSMVPYSKAIQDALKNTMRDLVKSNNNFRFGALLYRDASEGSANTIHYTRDLSSNYNGVNSLLSRYMTPTFNKCNNDPLEAVFYGIKKAVERFDPPVGESNFVILIGDAGNHSRTTYTDCSGKSQPEFTNVAENELVDLLAKKNINLYSYQVHHQIAADVKPAYDSFRVQVESLMKKTVVKRSSELQLTDAQIFKKTKGIVEIKSDLGIPGYFQWAPDGGSMHATVLTKSIETGIKQIDAQVNDQLNGISQYLNGKLVGTDAKQIKNFVKKLEAQNISADKLDIVFQKNGQVYNKGYVRRYDGDVKTPMFQDVLLMSQSDLLSIKKSLERLIPTDELSLSANESRSFIVYGWGEILVDILGYFPEVNEAVDTLSLYTLSAILTGWGGKEKYKKIKLLDVTSPDRFPDVMLYEYLIDWCITKGHIQSIYDGQNLLTEDFYNDHKWTIFSEYLFHLTKGSKEEDPTMGARFAQYYKKYNKEYNGYNPSFRIPMGSGSGLKHYWVDSRIFPHNPGEFGEEDLIDYLYKGFKK